MTVAAGTIATTIAAVVAALVGVARAPAQRPPAPPQEKPAGEPGEQRPAEKGADAPKPVDRVQQRLRDDLQKLAEALQKQPHGYRGTMRLTCAGGAVNRLDVSFDGAGDERCDWFRLDDWRVLQHGERSVVSQDDEAFHRPQGYSPELPLSPRLLDAHLLTAALAPPQPADFDGRPALRVHAKWTGAAAADVVRATVVPSGDHEQLMGAFASMAKRGREHVVVDGTLLYDPATARWLSTTLRFALGDGVVIEDEADRPAAPEGLPKLTSQPRLEVIWTLQRRPVDALPRFELDAAARRELGLDGEHGKR